MSDGFDVWVGLVEVRPLAGNEILEGDPGAFTNALTVAADAADYCTRAANFFRGEAFEVVSFESVERLADRGKKRSLPADILPLGEAASDSSEVQFDTYFTYRSTDEQARRTPHTGAARSARLSEHRRRLGGAGAHGLSR